MAFRTDASGEYARRTTDLPDDEAWTICGWSMLSADRNDYSCVVSLDDASARYVLIETEADGTTLMFVWNSGPTLTLTAVNVSEWFFWAIRASSIASNTGYIWRSSTGAWTSQSFDRTGFPMTATALYLNNNGFGEWMNGRTAAVKCWSGAALTQAEIEQERLSYLPLRTTNLHAFWPLLSHGDLTDYSGNGRSLTAGGTLSTEDGPPVAWRQGRQRRPQALTPPTPPAGRQTKNTRAFPLGVEVGMGWQMGG